MIFLQKFKTASWNILMVLFLALSFTACRDEQFDQPPSNGVDPNLTANKTILEVKNFFKDTVLTDRKTLAIDSNWVIVGTVIADDSTGNLYKSLIIDDGTAGISILLDRSDYFRDYPIGRRVFIKLQGMAVGSYGGMMQLGGYVDNTVVPAEVGKIPSSLISKYIVGGVYNLPVVPYDVTLTNLESTYKWQNRLIRLTNVQFVTTDTSEQFADPVTQATGEKYVEDCISGGNDIMVRTSGYSNFAGKLTPSGSGKLTAIFTIFQSSPTSTATKQLVLRRTYDLEMDNGRFVVGTCPPPPPPTPVLTSIADVKESFYVDGEATAPSGAFIRGVVISDYTNANLNNQNLFIQDPSGAICVRLTTSHTFQLGDSLQINVSDQSIGEFNGLLQIGSSSSVPFSNAIKIGIGAISPRVTTLSQLTANMATATDSWESSLVKITGVTISGGSGVYNAGNSGLTLTDASGTFILYTANSATFGSTNYPTGVVSITGILSEYKGTPQLLIRNTSDVQ
jgi:hypothetical protein